MVCYADYVAKEKQDAAKSQFSAASVFPICVVALSLCHRDRHLAALQALAGHCQRGGAGRRGRFDDDDALAVEGTHGGRGEDLGRGGVAVAAGVELGR